MNLNTLRYYQLIIILTSSIFVLTLNGCYAYTSVLSSDHQDITDEYRIYKLEKRNGDEVEFINDSLSRPQIQKSVISGMRIDSSQISIALNDVKRIYIRKPSTTATVVNVSIVSVLVGGIIYVTVQIINSGPNMNGALSGPL